MARPSANACVCSRTVRTPGTRIDVAGTRASSNRPKLIKAPATFVYASAPTIVALIEHEHPQIAALVLAHLEPPIAADVLQLLPAEALVADHSRVTLGAEDAARFLSGLRRRGTWADAPAVAVFGNEPEAFLGTRSMTTVRNEPKAAILSVSPAASRARSSTAPALRLLRRPAHSPACS